MGLREIDRFLEQWQMDARDLHRPFQMHHSFPWPSTRSPGQWPVWWFVRRPIAGNALPLGRGHVLAHRIPGKAGAHRGLPLAVPRLPTAEVRQWSPTRLPEWTNDPEHLAGSS